MDSSGFQSAIRSMDAQNTPSLPNGLTREETEATASVSGLTWHTPKPRGLVEELAAVAAERDRLREEVSRLEALAANRLGTAGANAIECVQLRNDCAALRTMNTELAQALDELYAAVKGECPSLLDEDSGGSSRLDIACATALAKVKP